MVYYRVSTIRQDSKADRKLIEKEYTEGKLDLNNIQGLTIRYYFYYPQDVGFNTHPHDLEFVKMFIRVKQVDDPVRNESGQIVLPTEQTRAARGGPSRPKNTVVYVEDVYGGAHGVTWYYNWLDLTQANQVLLPITVLVEEGKHASSPDRDGNGDYSPGYDVNRRLNDAWGVRDMIGSGELGGSRYEGYMTKRRDTNHRIMVMSEPGEGQPFLTRESLLHLYDGPEKEKLLRRGPSFKLVMVDHVRHNEDALCAELVARVAPGQQQQQQQQGGGGARLRRVRKRSRLKPVESRSATGAYSTWPRGRTSAIRCPRSAKITTSSTGWS